MCEMTRMPVTMHEEVQQDPVPQAMHVLLSEVLRKVPLRASGVLWEQSCVPLLQQLEDQGRWTKVPLSLTFSEIYVPILLLYCSLF